MGNIGKVRRILFLFVMAAIVGLASGAALTAQATSSACEADECEHGWFGDRCVDNPGQTTQCTMSGSTCTTGGCHAI